jgi:hypothetical protein
MPRLRPGGDPPVSPQILRLQFHDCGLSFGLIHPRPPPFTGGRLIVFAQVTDAGGRW